MHTSLPSLSPSSLPSLLSLLSHFSLPSSLSFLSPRRDTHVKARCFAASRSLFINMVKASPVTINIEPTAATIVHGCPGVSRSVPRIEAKLQIRLVNGQPFTVRNVGVELRTTQRVTLPATIGSTDSVHEYKLYEDPSLFGSTFGSFNTTGLIGIDIPLLIPLAKDIVSSGYNVNWNASTVHRLLVKVTVGENTETELSFLEEFPVPVKLYDALPIYRQFTESLNESIVSDDQQLIVDYNLKESCLGPNEDINLHVKVMKNSLNYNVSNRLKLRSVTFQLREILECHEGGLPPYKDIKLIDETREFNKLDLNSDATMDFNYKLPLNTDFVSVFDRKELELQKYQYFDDNNGVPFEINNHVNYRQNELQMIEGIPITHYQNFTTVGKLFSVRYEIQLKVKVVHGRDFVVRIPVILSPYNKISSEYLLTWILKQCKLASERFGKDMINRLATNFNTKDAAAALDRYKGNLTVYRYNKSDWVKLGFGFDALGTPVLTGYID